MSQTHVKVWVISLHHQSTIVYTAAQTHDLREGMVQRGYANLTALGIPEQKFECEAGIEIWTASDERLLRSLEALLINL